MNNNDTATIVTLDAADAIELAEILGWLRDWFAADPDTLAASMRRRSFGMFHLDEIDSDLRRFARLLGGDG